MSKDAKGGDGYFLHRALSSLHTVGSSEGNGWNTIREFWEALALGHVDELEAACWAQEIARRVVRDVLSAEAQERPKRALASIGLVGVEGTHLKESQYLQMYEEFRELVDEDKRSSRPTRRKLAEQMLKAGYFKGNSVHQAMNAIEYIQRKNPLKK